MTVDESALHERLLATAMVLAQIPDRGSASPGERVAAEWIVAELRAAGLGDARVETDRAHGGYWWPIGLLNALAVAGAAARRRWPAALALALLADDLDHRARVFRRLLPRRPTFTVTASAGDPRAPRTVVVVAHHDSARGGAIFDARAIELLARRAPRVHARLTRWPPLMWLTVLGPLLIVLGRRRTGIAQSLGTIVTMTDIARTPVTPGANDNASSVAVLLELARRVQPPPGVRLLLVSTGSEESNSEGMQAWGRRHFPHLDRATTTFVALETLGSGHLAIAEAEGFLVLHPYTRLVKDRLEDAARDQDIEIWRGLSNSFASDGQIALHAGYPTALLGALDELKLPRNYHKPWDTPDGLDPACMADAVRLLEGFVARS